MNDAPERVRRLEARLAQLTRQAEDNYAILQRSRSRELALLNALDLPALFDRLVAFLPESFGLAVVSVVLEDSDHEIRHLLMHAGRQPDGLPDVRLVDRLGEVTPALERLRAPWLGPFVAADHGPLFPGHSGLSSVALLPLRRGPRLIGSLNMGSFDAQRFTRHHGSELLAHLATIASYCLENTANRARLTLRGLTDALTGWHNRRYFETRLQEELARARREHRPLTCVLLDVDHFKAVNDTWGHPVGDRVLREMVQRIAPQVRASDVAARYGGEEFALLLPDTDIGDALRLAERIRQAVAERPFERDGGELAVTVSLGLAELPTSGDVPSGLDAQALLTRADAALYRAKAAGRNRVVVDP